MRAQRSSRSGVGEWSLRWPCDICGGTELALLPRPRPEESYTSALTVADEVGSRGCPGCHTRRKRAELGGREPEVWYDTILGEWVVRLPGACPSNSVIRRLGIRWFDAPMSLVQCAAADLAYAGDMFSEHGDAE